ncbi:hypothetical protein Mapa_012799 [Marchantia paleacea]|nr:hypothetical protein Mapa_012799 [Marchantia paleacea]
MLPSNLFPLSKRVVRLTSALISGGKTPVKLLPDKSTTCREDSTSSKALGIPSENLLLAKLRFCRLWSVSRTS